LGARKLPQPRYNNKRDNGYKITARTRSFVRAVYQNRRGPRHEYLSGGGGVGGGAGGAGGGW
jgi:hypothetical protein